MGELLLCLDIRRKLDIAVVFGSDQFRVGQGESEMMTYNEKHHWVIPLVPTACAYAKLDDYFWKIKVRTNRGFAGSRRFRDHLEVRKVTKSKSHKSQGKVENENR